MKRAAQLERLYPELHQLMLRARVLTPLANGVRERALARALAFIATPAAHPSIAARRVRGRA